MTDHLDTAQGHLSAAQAALQARADLYADTDAPDRARRLEALGAAARTGLSLGTLAAAIDLAESARLIADNLRRADDPASPDPARDTYDAAKCSTDLTASLLDERFGVPPVAPPSRHRRPLKANW